MSLRTATILLSVSFFLLLRSAECKIDWNHLFCQLCNFSCIFNPNLFKIYLFKKTDFWIWILKDSNPLHAYLVLGWKMQSIIDCLLLLTRLPVTYKYIVLENQPKSSHFACVLAEVQLLRRLH